MKRTLLLIAVVGLFAFLLTWDFAPRVDASRDKRRSNASPAGKSDGKANTSGTRVQNRSKAPTPVLFLQDKAEPPLIDLGSRTHSITGTIADMEEEDFDNPDLPAKKFLRKGIDEEEYHRLRDEYFASLRGLDFERPFPIAAKRAEAINLMNDQQEQMRPTAEIAGLSGPLTGSDWIEIGPGPIPNGQTQQFPAVAPVTGRATAVVVDPTNANKVYLGTAQGGVWRSTDGGASWTAIFDTAQSLAIGALALAPSDPTKLYVGTGEPNNSVDSFFGVGVYRIDNVDTTATLVGPINPSITTGTAPAVTYNCFNGRAISKILVHPTDPATIFVSTAVGFSGAAGNALSTNVPPLGLLGVFRSTNATAAAGAVTFSKLIVNTDNSLDGTPATGNTSIFDMVLDPGFDGGANQRMLVTTSGQVIGGAVYRSTNALAASPTFTQRLFPGFNGLVMHLTINKVGAVVTAYVASNEPSSAASGCGAQSGRVRKSIDGGVTWSTPLTAAEGYCGRQCIYDSPIAVDPNDANIVYLGGNARGTCSDVLKKSTNGGTTFTRDDTGLHADSHYIFVDTVSSPHIVWFVNDGGVWKRQETAAAGGAPAGTPWLNENNASLGTIQFVSLAVHPTDRFFTIGGTQDNGTEAQTVSSGNWVSAESGDGGFALIDQSATGTVNVTMYHTFFNQTTNFIGFDRTNLSACLAVKDSWELRGGGFANDPTPSCDGTAFALGNGINVADTVLFYAPMALGPGGAGNPNTLYFGTNKLYRSTNRGDTMTIVSQNPLIAGVAVSAIGISPTNDNVRIVGMRNGSVFATTTGSSVLTNTAFPIPANATASVTNRHIGRAVIDPANSNTAYVTLSYYTNPATAGQIWRTTNLNAATPTWTSIGKSTTGLPNIPVNAFAVDANDPSAPGVSVLYAGTDIGVYHSRDGGATWNPFGLGLPRVAVFDMAIQPTSGILRVATHGRGMWEIALHVNGPPVNTVPGAQNTNEDVPLVFTGATQISIADPDAGSAAVKVTLTAANGTISLSGTTGLIFTVGDGTSDATMTFTGTITDINTALNNLTFAPSLNYNGPASLTIDTDDQGNTGNDGAKTDTDTVNITVNPVNDQPTANAQAVATNEDTPLGIVLTGSDVETASGSLIYTVTVQPTNGVLSGTAPNLTYTPNSNYNGPDSFKFTVTDTGDGSSPALTSAEATISITVNAVNDAPVNSVPGAQNTDEDVPLVFTGATQISISDPDAGSADVKVTLTAVNGTFSLSGTTGLTFITGDGTNDTQMVFTGTIAAINTALDGLTFTPPLNFFSPPVASLTIVTDDQGNTGVGGAQTDSDTINITINSVNDPPSFTKGADQIVNEDAGAQTVNGWATNISSGAGDPAQTLTFNVSVTSTTGNLAFSSGLSIDATTGTLTYTTSPDTNGTASISVTLSDNGSNTPPNSNTSGAQTFNITVNAVNDAPSFQITSNPPTVNEDAGAQTVNSFATNFQPGPATATDESGQTLVGYTVTQTGTTGNLTFTSGPSIDNAGTLTYTPTGNTSGTATFNVVATDSGSGTAPNVNQSAPVAFTITVTGQNDAPVLDNSGNMSLNAINEDVPNASNNGTLVSDIIASAGGDRITDVDAGALEGIAVIAVDNTNGTWQFSIDNGTSWTDFGSPDTTTARLLASNATTRVRFVPNANFHGTIDPGITFHAWDQTSGTNGNTADVSTTGGTTAFSTATETASITVNAVNDTPTANAQAVATNEDTPLGIVLTGSDVETASGSLTYTVTVQPTNGVLSGTAPNLTYTPNSNYNGPDSFKFTVTDTGDGSSPALTSAEATVSIAVNAIADTPSVTNVTSNEDTQTTSGLVISRNPADGTEVTHFKITGITGGTLFKNNGTTQINNGDFISSAEGNAGLKFTPAANLFSPTTTFSFTVQAATSAAGAGLSSGTATATITVNSVNDVPSFTKGPDQSVIENSGAQTVNNWATNISAGPGNELGQTLTFQVTNNTNPGLFSTGPAISSTGTLTYTPAGSNSGTATITVVLMDNGGTANGGVDTSPSQTFNITVNQGGTLQFSAATYSVSESGVNATITITRTGGTAGTATVQFATSNGTATSADYTSVSQPVTFNDGESSKTVNIPITNDSLDENDETVNLTLSSVGGSGALGSPATAVLTINDDDATPSLSINDVTLAEGNSGTTTFTFTVTLTAASGLPVTVNAATADGTATAGSDYVAVPTTLLTFNPGETTKTVNVVVNGDIFNEPNETFFVNLSSATNATIADNQGQGTINNDDAIGGTIVFSASNYIVAENAVAGGVQITVNRNGTTTQAVTVDYATSDMTATERKDYTTALGTLRFDVGEDTKTFFVLVNVDAFTEGSELVGLTLSNPTGGAVLGVPANATIQINDSLWTGPPANPIDDAQFFVRQHYHDFLNREPDAPGLAFWTSQITGCGSDAACIEIKRIHVSAAFFFSIEFQETGVTAYLANKTAFGPPLPRYTDFEHDTQALQRGYIFTAPGSAAVLEANKVAFFNEFVIRPQFTAIYGSSMTNDQYVDALIANTGVTFTPAERDALVNGMNNSTETRATVLRKITEKPSFRQAEFMRSFVIMQYFGYLRRNPDDAPDNNLSGYDFWLNKLNQFNGDFVKAEMVKAFLISIEYRQRFGN